MNNLKKLLVTGCTVTAFVAFSAAGAFALTIDTNPTWDGNTNFGWAGGSGQSFTVDPIQTRLTDISFYFDADSAGKTFDFFISDALSGGTTFLSTSFNVTAGINTFGTNIIFAPGSLIYAFFDYHGFSGRTANFSSIDGYSGGQSFFQFNQGGPWDTSYTSFDHRFIANFAAPSAIPVPAALPLLLTGLAGMGVLSRRRKSKKTAV